MQIKMQEFSFYYLRQVYDFFWSKLKKFYKFLYKIFKEK